MCENINEMLNKDGKTAEYYQNAKGLWDAIDVSTENLKEILLSEQLEFEHLCGGRNAGQKIMVCYGITQYLQNNTSDYDSAQKVFNAFIQSGCSIEVKQYARDIAKEYGLD